MTMVTSCTVRPLLTIPPLTVILTYLLTTVCAGITRFGDVARLITRNLIGQEDWYGTGHRRDLYYYADIGIIKSILIGKTGDITRNTIPSNSGARQYAHELKKLELHGTASSHTAVIS